MSTRRGGIVLLAGGLGGARLAPALRDRLPAGALTVIANVGDDLEWMGLRVSPDLDSITYALAGLWDAARGWGRRGETFRVRGALERFPTAGWFGIGDADLSLHLARSAMLRSGMTLGAATERICRRLGAVGVKVLPASEQRCGTRIRLADGGIVAFQEWYVRDGARPRVREALLAKGRPAPEAVAALRRASAVVLAPSNPVTSIGAILALDGVMKMVRASPLRIAVSPVVRRIATADESVRHHARARQRLLAAEGRRDTPAAIAARYAGLVDYFILDEADCADVAAVRRAGVETVLADLLDARALAASITAVLATSRTRAPTSRRRRGRGIRRRSP